MTKYFENEELFDYVAKNGSYNELLTFLGRLHADRVESQALVGEHYLGDWKVGKSRPDVYRREIQTFRDCTIDDAAAGDFIDWFWNICRAYGGPDVGVKRYGVLLSIGYYLSVGEARKMLHDAVMTEAQARQYLGGPDPYDDNYLKSILIELVNNDPQYLM